MSSVENQELSHSYYNKKFVENKQNKTKTLELSLDTIRSYKKNVQGPEIQLKSDSNNMHFHFINQEMSP